MKTLLLALVQGYRLFFRAWLGSVCRFEPSCSAYATEALTVHGAAAGSYLTLRRLVRCQPWCDGGHDPVPDLRAGTGVKGLFTRFKYQADENVNANSNARTGFKNTAKPVSRIPHFSEKTPP